MASTEDSNEAPILKFNIVSCTPSDAVDFVGGITMKFKYLYEEFVGKIVRSFYRRGYVFRGELDAPTNEDICTQVVGSTGKYFSMTEEKSGADLIWNDRTKNKFYFFGSKSAVVKAMHIITHRIKICTERLYSTDFKLCPVPLNK